jgi:hypothetical protein
MLFRPHTYNTIVEDEIGHSMAEIQPPEVGLETSSSPETNINVEGGDVQNKERVEWPENFEKSTVGLGGGFLGLGYHFEGDMTVPRPNNQIAESNGQPFAYNYQELSIDLDAIDNALFYDNTPLFKDMMEGFEFPDFLNALAFEATPATSEGLR